MGYLSLHAGTDTPDEPPSLSLSLSGTGSAPPTRGKQKQVCTARAHPVQIERRKTDGGSLREMREGGEGGEGRESREGQRRRAPEQ